MNIRLYSIIIAMAMTSVAGAQNIRVANNFVIAINDKVVISSILNVKLIARTHDGQESSMNVGYVPGDLYYNGIEDKNKAENDTSQSLILQFDNYAYQGNRQKIKTYRIPLKRSWFQYTFVVLRLFDFKGQKSPSYKYIMDFPGYSMFDKKRT